MSNVTHNSCDIQFTIFKSLPHTRQHVWQELEYRIDVYRITRDTHIENL